eukprot:CCRYP_018588-RB/>CCRYP_018588-RB protein AED:0.29 eAED:0.29 QI:100/1/1/1/0.8/0.66/6/1051/628
MSTPAQDSEHELDSSIDDDLRFLNEMDIDRDFNVWSDFRLSFTEASKESIRNLRMLRGSIGDSTLGSISESAACPGIADVNSTETAQSKLHRGDSEASIAKSLSSLYVKFSPLSAAERRDIRSWAVRLERKQVFSRYYFPEQWEIKEKEAIRKELMLTEPTPHLGFKAQVDSLSEVTQATIKSIFFPGDHDPKSVLLKRGPTFLDAADERELLLFTHGFVLSRIEFDNFLNLLFDMNAVKFVSQEHTAEEMQKRFEAIDSDGSGELDRYELREVFQSMGVPPSEQMLTELMNRFDIDDSGTIDFREFKQVLSELASKDKPQCNEGNTFMKTLRNTLMGKLSQSDIKRKLDVAFPLTDIDRVESLNICCSSKTKMFANSSLADVSFAVFIRFRKHPLILVCSKPEQREAWVDAFRVCLVNSRNLSGDKFQREEDDKPGWQHTLVRDSLFSLIVCDDYSGLSRYLEDPPADSTVNDHDEYYGFTALHFAVIWDRLECAALLLSNGAKVNAKDNDKKTPRDHALDKNMIKLLQRYGGQGNPNLKSTLFDQAQEEHKLNTNNKTQTKIHPTISHAKKTTSVMSDATSAMRERGEKLEKLDKATSELERDAANYADVAKQLKEKTKKKFLFGL